MIALQDHFDHQNIINLLNKNRMKDIIFDINKEEAFKDENRKVWLTEVMKDSLEHEVMDLSVNLWD
jgi:hypothetical protein